MAEGEGSQEGAQRRGGHHPERQHPPGGPGAQLVDVINVRTASQDRHDQRKHLAARPGPADPADQPHHVIDDRLQAEAHHQRRRQQQPGIGDQRRVIKGRTHPVDPVRYCTHRKCLLDPSEMTGFATVILPGQEALFGSEANE